MVQVNPLQKWVKIEVVTIEDEEFFREKLKSLGVVELFCFE